MKLTNSKTEDEFRRTLENSIIKRNSISTNSELHSRFISHITSFNTAITLNVIPEQGEDFYTFLIDLTTIVIIQIPKDSNQNSILIKSIDIESYQYKLKKREKIKLYVALDIAQKNQ